MGEGLRKDSQRSVTVDGRSGGRAVGMAVAWQNRQGCEEMICVNALGSLEHNLTGVSKQLLRGFIMLAVDELEDQPVDEHAIQLCR